MGGPRRRGLRVILAGGGGAAVSRPLDEVFARGMGAGGRLLYLPVAWVSGPYESCFRWVHSVFEPLAVREIEMWTDLAGKTDTDLERFAGIYLGGGNTFKLLAHVRATGFDGMLRRFAARGGPVYGGSAGAIVLGEDIGTCAHMDPNDVALRDTTGLGLALGHDVWCHYEDAEAPRVAAYAGQQRHRVLDYSRRMVKRLERHVRQLAVREASSTAHCRSVPSLAPAGRRARDAPGGRPHALHPRRLAALRPRSTRWRG
jgi:dipeptidase E